MTVVSVCLPFDPLSQCLLSYLGFTYLGCGVSLHSYSRKVQPLQGSSLVIQVYVPTSNNEEAEVEQFYEDLQDLLELTPQKDVLFILGDWNAKVGS